MQWGHSYAQSKLHNPACLFKTGVLQAAVVLLLTSTLCNPASAAGPSSICPNPYNPEDLPGYVLIDNLCPKDELLVATVRWLVTPPDLKTVTGYKSDGWMSVPADAKNFSNWGRAGRDNVYVSVIRKKDLQPVKPYIYATQANGQQLKFVDISSTKKKFCTAGYIEPGVKYTGVPYRMTLAADGTTVLYDDFTALGGSDKTDYSKEGGRPCLSFNKPKPRDDPGMPQAKGTLVDFYLLGACKFVVKDCSR